MLTLSETSRARLVERALADPCRRSRPLRGENVVKLPGGVTIALTANF